MRVFCNQNNIDPVRKLDEWDLLRFCRARKFKHEDIKKMLLAYAKWRVDADIEDIANTFVFSEHEEVLKYYPHNYHGVCKIGRPVYIERTGFIDCPNLFRVCPMERMMRHCL